MMAHSIPRLVNPPIDIFFAGFQANTYQLYQCGWEIHANQDQYENSLSLALSHKELGIILISPKLDYNYYQMAVAFQTRTPIYNLKFKTMPFQPDYRFYQQVLDQNFDNFQNVSGKPEMISEKITCLEDCFLFKPKTELLVEPQTVQQMMDVILSKQSEKQKELREKHRKAVRREINRETEIIQHCQILSVVEKV